jgi:hypothetical protein
MSVRCLIVAIVGLAAAVATGCAEGGSASAPAPAPAPNVSGTWRNAGNQAMRPTSGDIPFTPWGAEQAKKERPTFSSDFRETTDPAVLYADPNGYPRIIMHPMKFKLVQTNDYVYQLFEYNQNWRQIALNKTHAPDDVPTWYGNAVGKWDGDTLVVDSTGYKPSTWLDSRGLPHTENLHIIERIRREGEMLLVDLTFEDPGAFTKPWSAQLKYERVDDGAMIETIYTISDELRFRERFLGVPAPIPIRR